MNHNIKDIHAFVLAAGLGKRMKHLTKEIPKPLVEVNGKSLIDYSLDSLVDVGIRNVVVNLHYKSKELRLHLKKRLENSRKLSIKFSNEKNLLLDTGGGISKGINMISSNPFYILNSDTIRVDCKINSLNQMLDFWNEELMDYLLLLYPFEKAVHYSGLGDFHLSQRNIITRISNEKNKKYIYTGVCLANTSNFLPNSKDVFSINGLWDKSIQKKRLYGIVHYGDWFHVGTPEELLYVQRKLNNT